jgi:pyruvate/oxaloacetate carboxyltransferase
LRDAVDRFLTNLEHIVDDVIDRFVKQAAARGLLDLTYCIDLTDERAMPADPDTSKNYGPSAEEYYYG